MADNRLPDALEDYRRILAAGVNVVGSSAVFRQHPWQVLFGELVKPIEEAATAARQSSATVMFVAAPAGDHDDA